MAFIKLNDVVKRYDNNLAVDNVSMTISKGEIFGLLGPNGAGKSTVIKMIIGLLRPNSGVITIDDKSIVKSSLEIKRIMGLVPQELAIYPNLTTRENIEFFGRLYGLRGRNLKERVDESLQFTGLSESQKEKPKKFSGGMKRRLNIACAIAHQPQIIIMDEPTVGIDPQSRIHILESVKELNRRGSTVIYTSHYMEEVEAVCTRVGIIDHGKLIALGSLQLVKELQETEQKIIIQATDIRFNPVDQIKRLVGVKGVSLSENLIEISTANAQENLQDILFILSNANVRVKDISIKEPDLESVFLSLTGRKLRD